MGARIDNFLEKLGLRKAENTPVSTEYQDNTPTSPYTDQRKLAQSARIEGINPTVVQPEGKPGGESGG